MIFLLLFWHDRLPFTLNFFFFHIRKRMKWVLYVLQCRLARERTMTENGWQWLLLIVSGNIEYLLFEQLKSDISHAKSFERKHLPYAKYLSKFLELIDFIGAEFWREMFVYWLIFCANFESQWFHTLLDMYRNSYACNRNKTRIIFCTMTYLITL